MFRRLQDAHNAPDSPSLRLASGLSVALESPRSRVSASGCAGPSPPSGDPDGDDPAPVASGLDSSLGFSVESSAVDPVGVPVGAVVAVGEPEEAEEDAVPVEVGVDVADGDEVAVEEGLDEPLGFSGFTSLFVW